MILYSNSDSYGIMSTGLTYSDFMGQALDATVINSGKPGSCNQRIFRTTVRDLIRIRQQTNEPVLCLICLGSLIRGEWWNSLKNVMPDDTDGNFQSFQIHSDKNSDTVSIKEYMEQWYRIYDDEAMQTNLLMELVLLTSWFSSNNIEYIVFAGNSVTYKEIDYNDIFIGDFSKIVFADKNILNINNFSFATYCCSRGHVPFDYNRYKEHGHHGQDAHEDFANFLLDHYNERRH